MMTITGQWLLPQILCIFVDIKMWVFFFRYFSARGKFIGTGTGKLTFYLAVEAATVNI